MIFWLTLEVRKVSAAEIRGSRKMPSLGQSCSPACIWNIKFHWGTSPRFIPRKE